MRQFVFFLYKSEKDVEDYITVALPNGKIYYLDRNGQAWESGLAIEFWERKDTWTELKPENFFFKEHLVQFGETIVSQTSDCDCSGHQLLHFGHKCKKEKS